MKDVAALSKLGATGTKAALLDWVKENTAPARDGTAVNTKALGHYLKQKRGTPRSGRKLSWSPLGRPRPMASWAVTAPSGELNGARRESCEGYGRCQEHAAWKC